jgi:hypothetical protein
VVVVAVVVVVALLVGVGAWLWSSGDDDAVATSPTTEATAPTTEPDESTVPPTTDDTDEVDPELATAIEELEAFVEEERGLEFKEEVEVELVSQDEFDDRLLADFEESRDDIETAGRVYQALGLLEPGIDVVAALEQALTAGVAGFYDPETDELVVLGEAVTPYTKQVIVHELVHALDDQWFELDRPEIDDADDESSVGFSALVEGDATVVQTAYISSLSGNELAELSREATALLREVERRMGDVPQIIRDELEVVYLLGETFVGELLDDGGQEAVDAAFDDPPTTSKEIMDPSRYLEGFEPTPVETPTADGDVFDEGVIGQLLVEWLLDVELDEDEAAEVADGWAGDRYVAWEEGEETCVRFEIASLDDAAGAELAKAFQAWANEQPDAEVDELDSGLVQVTSCVTGASGGGGTSPS